MFSIFLYLLAGAACAYAFRLESGRPAWSEPLLGIFVMLLWPVLVLHALVNAKRIKGRGKVIWERKS